MEISITFKTFDKNNPPKHGEDIIVLDGVERFGFTGFNPTPAMVQYSWEELEEDGSPNGMSYCYEEDTVEEFLESGNYRLEVLCFCSKGGSVMNEKTLYTTENDYWSSFDEYYK